MYPRTRVLPSYEGHGHMDTRVRYDFIVSVGK
jgi:hypothetical protein